MQSRSTIDVLNGAQVLNFYLRILMLHKTRIPHPNTPAQMNGEKFKIKCIKCSQQQNEQQCTDAKTFSQFIDQ